MTDQPKFAIGQPVIYANNTPQRRRGDRAVIKNVAYHDGAYWRYDLAYLDGSSRASMHIREINLEADPDTRTVFITMPGGAEHLTLQLASDHAREWRNMTILKAAQERTGHGWTITACDGPVEILPVEKKYGEVITACNGQPIALNITVRGTEVVNVEWVQ